MADERCVWVVEYSWGSGWRPHDELVFATQAEAEAGRDAAVDETPSHSWRVVPYFPKPEDPS